MHRLSAFSLISLLTALCLVAGRSAEAQASRVFFEKLLVERSDIDRGGSMPNTYAPVVKRVLPAVVSISSARVTQRPADPVWDEILRRYLGEGYVPPEQTLRQQQGLGSGVLVTSDGFIITNFHVIQGANEITVTLPESRRSYEATVMAADPSTDVALLKIEGEGTAFPQAVLGDSGRAEVGDVVLAVGNPFELDQTVTQGIVSAKGRSNVGPGGQFYGNFIQTDAAINPGNSGGALVDSSGRVIGINSMIYSTSGGSTGIGFAIPINMALQVIGDLLDQGRIARGYLGVQLEGMNPALARRLGRRDLSGAIVEAVVPGSPADRAGLRPHDLILSYQKRGVTDPASLRLEVSRTAPGTEVVFDVLREGRMIALPAVLGEVAGQSSYVNPEGLVGGGQSLGEHSPAVVAPKVVAPPVAETPPSGESAAEEVPGAIPFYLRGVVIQTLDDALRTQLGLDAAYEGAVVIQVNPRSAAGRQGLQVGDLIVEVGNQPVRSAREAHEAGGTEKSVTLGIIREGKEVFILVEAE